MTNYGYGRDWRMFNAELETLKSEGALIDTETRRRLRQAAQKDLESFPPAYCRWGHRMDGLVIRFPSPVGIIIPYPEITCRLCTASRVSGYRQRRKSVTET